jgi:hypothetical protein
MANLIFKPIGLFFGLVLARKVGTKGFDKTWQTQYGTKAPTATTEQATWPQVVGAAALKGTIVAVTAAVFTRSAAKSFRYLTGFWPGEERPEPAGRISAAE